MVGFGQGYLPVWQYIPGFSTGPLFWNTRPAHGVTCGGDRGQASTVMNVFVILIMINLNVDQRVIVAETVNINQWETAKACV